MEHREIANYLATERLREGGTVTIRAIRPDDKGRVTETLLAVSPESLYRRTFSARRHLTAAELKQLTEVDFENVIALVAVMNEEGADRIVGGGRYLVIGPAGRGQAAEVAFLVDDAHQGLGIGSRIFRHLAAIGRAAGIAQFVAEVLPSNEGMLRLFERTGLPVIKTASREAVHVIIELAPAGKNAQPAGDPGAGELSK
jgi:ribosomal protein S18 acetylase RimI-like enzyme